MQNKSKCIQYEFFFPDDSVKKMTIRLDKNGQSSINPTVKNKPKWISLDYMQCECCPLDVSVHPICPISKNLVYLLGEFSDAVSHDKCHIKCITPERIYLKHSSVQDGLYSIFGLIMATSGCPVMDFFRPLARFHLPFSTIEETKMRVISIYFLKEYLQHRDGDKTAISLKDLDDFYDKVQMVNIGIMKRIRTVTDKDASANAIMGLYAISQMLSMEIEHNLGSLKELFSRSNTE